MFNSPYLSQSLPYPFLSLFGDVSIPIQDEDEDENENEEQQEQENEESVTE